MNCELLNHLQGIGIFLEHLNVNEQEKGFWFDSANFLCLLTHYLV